MAEIPYQSMDADPVPPSRAENRLVDDRPFLVAEEPVVFMEQSPFEEVAANVSNHDDPSMLCFTFRSLILGLLFTCILAFVNQFFAFRTSPLNIDIILVQLLAYPLGKLLASVLPTRTFSPFGTQWQFSLNPGAFTIKEHCIIATMADTASSVATGMDVIAAQRVFYKHAMTFTSGLLFILSSQILGYGIVGVLRRFLIWPAAAIWPRTLINCALLQVMHRASDDEDEPSLSRSRMSRYRFFYLALLFQVLWYWIPGFICPVLSYFSLFCVIFPNNVIISQVTGVNGLGFGSFELDWNSWAAFLGSPIAVPLWAHVNIFVGFVIFVWVITPIAYYSNWWNAQVFPIASYRVFTTEGYIYNVTNVLDSQLNFNETAYRIYGPIQLSFMFALTYGTQFVAISAILVHSLLYDGKTFYQQCRSSFVNVGGDIHAKLMAQYPEVPSWWYTLLFVCTLIASAIICVTGHLMPWYLLLVDVLLVLVFILPTGFLAAISSISLGINTIAEFLAGIIMPGNPVANMTFKVYGYGSQSQAISLLASLKFGHYMKVPPRTMFLTQLLGTLVGGVINYVTAVYLLDNVPNICTLANRAWKCPSPTAFYSASIIWGVIGPVRMFGQSSIYSPLLFGFLLGALLPVPAWLLLRKYPQQHWLEYVHFPIMLSGISLLPMAPAGEYPVWFLVGFLFNFVLFRYAHSWWRRYAFLFSAAMSCGVATSAVLIFFVFQNNGIDFPTWWGTGGPTGDGCPLANGNFSGDLPRYESL